MATPEEDEKVSKLQKKFFKNFHRADMLRCLPIIWSELVKMKGRVDEVLGGLSAKRVKQEKTIEFKKQVVTNKALKDYFKSNPAEKEIL